MDSKRGYRSKTHQSSSGSSSNSPAAPGSPSPASPHPTPGGGRVGLGLAGNAFANDGSFMEMFKKKMEAEKMKKETERGCGDTTTTTSPEEGQSTQEKKSLSVTSFVGKRRGGAKLALKTGMVAKKQKVDPEIEPGKGDAWQHYMAEVKKYKAHQCGDDDKTRPLVK